MKTDNREAFVHSSPLSLGLSWARKFKHICISITSKDNATKPSSFPSHTPDFDEDKQILSTVIYCNSFQALVVIFVRVSWRIFGATRDRLGCKDKVDRSAVA